MRTTETILDDLEVMDSQVKNGGFYQWWYNVLEHEKDLTTLKTVMEAISIGFEEEYSHYDTLFIIMGKYADAIKNYRNLRRTYDEEELEAREEVFIEQIEKLDDLYYSIDEEVTPHFEKIAKILIKQKK
jgi:hypothetical protein